MAIKVFCDACETFIRNARDDELSDLKGGVICPDCEGKINELFTFLDKHQKQTEQKIRVVFSDARATLERRVRKVMKSER